MSNVDFNAWQKGRKESFLQINFKSNIKDDWLRYKEVLGGEFKNSIIKPINKYMQKLAIPPKLLSIDDNIITLCQHNFAEIFLLDGKDTFSAMEKIHMRQFYLSDKTNIEDAECFNNTYRWAMTWFIDYEGLNINILNVEGSPFKFEEISYISKKENSETIDPKMLFFNFKRSGNHMRDQEYGRIKRDQPAFLISFKANDEVVEKVKEFYVYN